MGRTINSIKKDEKLFAHFLLDVDIAGHDL